MPTDTHLRYTPIWFRTIIVSLVLIFFVSSTAAQSIQQQTPKPQSPVTFSHYTINSQFWNDRIKNTIVNWIPHCYTMLDDTSLKEGGMNNIIEAGKKLKGLPAGRHRGYVFSNAYVFNTLEAMCYALMVDPKDDQEIIKVQKEIRAKINEWIPIILQAQEKDGYFQTSFTLRGLPHWTRRGDHEGYVAGYFLEVAIAHYTLTGGKEKEFFDAAKRLADCWYKNIGPAPKKVWWDGHQEMEQALARFGRFVNTIEGKGKGEKYIELAKFLLDSRKGDGEYDQSHKYPVEQDEAVGHAVRAVYQYSGMTDVAILTGSEAYYHAVNKLWDNVVNKKLYVTGSVGTGETSEGFGKNYSLPTSAYTESCAGCGMLFWQHKMNLAYGESKYADLMELALYNGILGSLDLDGKNFTYTNPLDQSHDRYKWHVCPCCVGNIPRTLLQLPTWMYSKSEKELTINLFVGSTVDVGQISGTAVQVVQTTRYPWDGNISIALKPRSAKLFTVRVRIPNRNVSTLYSTLPEVNGATSVAVNGKKITPVIRNGYLVLNRTWKAGDKIDLVLPMKVQRVKAIDTVFSTRGRVALQYGPLVYNIENVDYADGDVNKLILNPDATLSTEWKSELLGGSLVIKSTFSDGTPIMAIPNYLRNNRGGRSIVWMHDRQPVIISPISYNARPSTSFCSSWESVYGLNDQVEPKNSNDRSGLIYGNWDHKKSEWVQYTFDKQYTISSTEIYWFVDNEGISAPASWTMQFWDGSKWIEVQNPSGYSVDVDKWNHCTFDPVTTNRVRLYINAGKGSTGVAEWKIQ
ncbi:MAG: beta-L-arabinofuranosidase domain-containing protein [bacterium]